MNKIRVIPVLLLRDWGLEKTIQFGDPVYVGSPINAARVFNGRNVDELILLDIVATEEGRGPRLEIVSQIAEEAFLPFTVGGGIRDVDTVGELLRAGADRVAINTALVEQPDVVTATAARFGRQCVVASIDVRQQADGRYEVFTRRGRRPTGIDPVAHARHIVELGAGEIFLQSIDRDGTMRGYDIELVRRVADAVDVPVIACGGAGRVEDLGTAVRDGHADAVAAGAFFLFFGPRRTVLITYPDDDELGAALDPARIRDKRANPTVTPPGTVRN